MASSTTLSQYLENAWIAISVALGLGTTTIIPSQPFRIKLARTQHDELAGRNDLEMVAGPPGCPLIQVETDDSVTPDFVAYWDGSAYVETAFAADV